MRAHITYTIQVYRSQDHNLRVDGGFSSGGEIAMAGAWTQEFWLPRWGSRPKYWGRHFQEIVHPRRTSAPIFTR